MKREVMVGLLSILLAPAIGWADVHGTTVTVWIPSTIQPFEKLCVDNTLKIHVSTQIDESDIEKTECMEYKVIYSSRPTGEYVINAPDPKFPYAERNRPCVAERVYMKDGRVLWRRVKQ